MSLAVISPIIAFSNSNELAEAAESLVGQSTLILRRLYSSGLGMLSRMQIPT